MEMIESDRLKQILKDFAVQLPEIQGLALVSAEGQPLIPPIGLDENSAEILAGTILHLAGQMRNELQWQQLEQVSLRGAEGYVRLAACTEDTFLLIQATGVSVGSLERDIRQIIKALQVQLDGSNSRGELAASPVAKLQDLQPDTAFKLAPTPTVLEPDFIRRCQQELAEFIGPIAPMLCQRLLAKNEGLSPEGFIELLSQQIPSQQQALEFQRRLRFRGNSDMLG
jgi:predicted regulator of Ras-like GTPase activity (Roadblock/LC7/MglB family)